MVSDPSADHILVTPPTTTAPPLSMTTTPLAPFWLSTQPPMLKFSVMVQREPAPLIVAVPWEAAKAPKAGHTATAACWLLTVPPLRMLRVPEAPSLTPTKSRALEKAP